MRKTLIWWSVNDQKWIAVNEKKHEAKWSFLDDKGLERNLANLRTETENSARQSRIDILRDQFWNKRFRWNGERIVEVE